jgi:CTP:molybdopterin cytidylyltransferase MocA
MSPVKNAVIAAAGLGSRLGLGMPKCMIPINKIPILARMIRMLEGYVDTVVVVTGYREELVLEYCQIHFRDVVIARNPDFATTNTAQSLSIGGRFVSGKTIFLDGDLLLERKSLDRFFKLGQSSELMLGVSRAKTDQPVYADCHGDDLEYLTIKGFSRENPTPYEWANLFVGPNDVMDGAGSFVFEKLAENLPLQAASIEVEEVDTPQDMARAEATVKGWEA